MKNLLFFTLPLFLFMTYSCKKKIYGCTDNASPNYSTKATVDDGSCITQASNQVNVQEFSLIFGPLETQRHYAPTFDFAEGDIIIIEKKTHDVSGNQYWSSLPFISNDLNIWGEYSETDGDIWIYSEYVSTGDPYVWPGDDTLYFRAILIKHKAAISHPGIENWPVEEILRVQ